MGDSETLSRRGHGLGRVDSERHAAGKDAAKNRQQDAELEIELAHFADQLCFLLVACVGDDSNADQRNEYPG